MARAQSSLKTATQGVTELTSKLDKQLPQTLNMLEKVGAVAIGAMVAITTIAAIALVVYLRNNAGRH